MIINLEKKIQSDSIFMNKVKTHIPNQSNKKILIKNEFTFLVPIVNSVESGLFLYDVGTTIVKFFHDQI